MASSYEGRAYHESFPGGKGEGTITLTDDLLRFEGGGKSVTFPLERVTIERGGAAQRLIFFRESSQPDWTVFTGDDVILKDPVLAARPETAAQLRGLRKKYLVTGGIIAGLLLMIGLAVIGALKLKDPIVKIVADRVPLSWEKKLGDAVFAQVSMGSRFITTPEIDKQLDALVAPLMKGVREKRYDFKFHIVAQSDVNAFALPGGNVIIHTGLIALADSPEEVLGVLAHEIAHVSRRHSVRQIIQTAGLYLVVQSFFGDMSGMIAVIADQGAFLASRQFSRDFETEADETGWGYLVAADIDPRGMASFFRKLHAKGDFKGRLETALSFMSTHPASKERADNLDKKWETMYTRHRFVKVKMDFKAFQDALGGGTENKK